MDEKTLRELIEWARSYEMTPEERREQAISFAYGNAAIENPLITREMVEQAAERLRQGAAE